VASSTGSSKTGGPVSCWPRGGSESWRSTRRCGTWLLPAGCLLASLVSLVRWEGEEEEASERCRVSSAGTPARSRFRPSSPCISPVPSANMSSTSSHVRHPCLPSTAHTRFIFVVSKSHLVRLQSSVAPASPPSHTRVRSTSDVTSYADANRLHRTSSIIGAIHRFFIATLPVPSTQTGYSEEVLDAVPDAAHSSEVSSSVDPTAIDPRRSS
jgi:hypothetical protein